MPLFEEESWEELIEESGHAGKDEIRWIEKLEVLNEKEQEYQLRLECATGYAAHQLGSWLTRHCLVGPNSAEYIMLIQRSAKESPPVKEQGMAVDEGSEQEDESDECDEEARSSRAASALQQRESGKAGGEPCYLACEQCNFVVDVGAPPRAIVIPDWVTYDAAWKEDPLSVWEVHSDATTGAEVWGVRSRCRQCKQFCSSACHVNYLGKVEPEEPLPMTEYYRRLQKEREERDLILLAAVEMKLYDICKKSPVPPGEDGQRLLSRKYLFELEDRGWGERWRPVVLKCSHSRFDSFVVACWLVQAGDALLTTQPSPS